MWKRAIGYVPLHGCKRSGGGGFVSTATVAPDPVTGAPTIYVAAGDGYLYALDAADGSTRWRSVVGIPTPGIDDYYNWASPTVVAGRISMGVSSNCDRPFVPGGLDEFDQATGDLIATYRSMPEGYLGGGVWTSAMATDDGQTVWVTTASTTNGAAVLGDSYSLVRLDGATLARLDAWQIPAAQRVYDSDFGSSPVLIQAPLGGVPTDLVVACNKNGIFYAWRAYDVAAGPVWQRRVAFARRDGLNRLCLAAAVWDGRRLFVATNGTTIAGKRYLGSARRLDPATGVPIWETGLNGAVTGTPTLDGAGVLAVATHDFTGAMNRVYLLDAETGAILRKLGTTAPAFPQPVMADTHLLVATQNHGLIAFGLPPALARPR